VSPVSAIEIVPPAGPIVLETRTDLWLLSHQSARSSRPLDPSPDEVRSDGPELPSDPWSATGAAGAVGFGAPGSEHEAITKAPRIAGNDRSSLERSIRGLDRL